MKWQDRRRSSNVNDARGRSSGGGYSRGGGSYGGGGGGGFSLISLLLRLFGGSAKGILVIVIIVVLLVVFTDFNPLGMGQTGSQPEQPRYEQREKRGGSGYQETPKERERREFLAVVLAETEDTWHKLFREMGKTYHEPVLTIFKGHITSACGSASSAAGPFYCGGDKNVYIDLQFFDELSHELGAKGDFAMAYVLAHEVGHHVQNELGVLGQVHKQRRGLSKKAANDLTVRLELQADYLAGVWAHYAERAGILEEGDVEEAIRATQAIGDDTLQKRSKGIVVPDSFTHGTAEQRTRWFMKGYRAGDLSEWDTFSAASSRDLYVKPNTAMGIGLVTSGGIY